jgi:ribosomal protein S18 acetylase RimI-like enzyme
MGEPSVRSYRPEDRAAVRHICHETGYMGEPAAWYWRDRESFADLFSGYYTDREPESALVAESAGRVVGYLLGCVDSRRATPAAAVLRRHLLGRGIALRPGTAGFIWRSVFDLCRDPGIPQELRDARWPAHLHIDLLPEARGQGVGAALMRRWLERLAALDSPGCHLGTFHENHDAIAFFERMGFRRHAEPRLVPGFRLRSGGRMHVQFLTRTLGSGARPT